MDLTLVYLVAGFVVSALYFEFRVRRLLKNIVPLAIQRVQSAFLVKNVSKAEDGTEIVSWALSAPAKGIVAMIAPVLIAEGVAWARKNIKVKGGGGIVPGLGGMDLQSMLSPEFIGAGLAKVLPKEARPFAGIIGNIVTQLIGPLLGNLGGGGGAAAKPTDNPFLKGLIP